MANSTLRRIFPDSIDRLQYLVRFLALLGLILVLIAVISGVESAVLSTLDRDQRHDFVEIEGLALLVLCIPILLLRIFAIDIPRMRSSRLSPWLLFLLFVPGINLILQLVLFLHPPRGAHTIQED